MAVSKVSDEAIQADFDAGMTLKDIAEKYDLSLMTVYRRKKSLELKSDPDYEQKRAKDIKIQKELRDIPAYDPPTIKPFSLNVGDFVKDVETEISRTINTYRVVEIFDNFFTCEKINGLGHWKTSILKIDWQLGLIGKGRNKREGRKDDDSKD
jgi:hypothetical protein